MTQRPQNWQPNQQLPAARLAWIAAKPELQRRATPWWAIPLRLFFGALSLRTGNRRASVVARGGSPGLGEARQVSEAAMSSRMAAYSVAVDIAAERLTQEEKVKLRELGELPDWFFEAVENERTDYIQSRRSR